MLGLIKLGVLHQLHLIYLQIIFLQPRIQHGLPVDAAEGGVG
jgi:hypothetical protein